MKITLANKKLLTKPYNNIDKAKYFKNLRFKTGNFKQETFKKIIENGYTITYLYKDDEFERTTNYMSANYVGTQYICVDIDAVDISPIEFAESVKFKPTYIHTTFSNLTPQKENKYCYHLIYCFDEIILGEENFHTVFQKLTEDYTDYVDNAAKDCHRVIFTTNSKLENYYFKDYNIIYKVKDFVSDGDTENFDEIDTFFEKSDVVVKKENTLLFTTSNYKRAFEKNATPQKTKKIGKNSWNLDETFWEDLNTMNRSAFISKYLLTYPYITNTIITNEMLSKTSNGILYADLRGIDYYEVPSKFRYNPASGKKEIQKIQKGHRNKYLLEDALYFIKCIPDITKEYLVTMLLNEVSKYYDNRDKELTNYRVVSIAKWAWEKKDDINIEPTKRKFKILVSENMRKMQAVGVLNKLMKDDEIGANLDLLLTVEENIEQFKNSGIKITKNRLLQFLEEYEITLKTNKEVRNEKVIDLQKENPTLSLRELEKLCKENGININYTTIQRILKKN